MYYILWVGIGRLWTPKHPLGQTVVTVCDTEGGIPWDSSFPPQATLKKYFISGNLTTVWLLEMIPREKGHGMWSSPRPGYEVIHYIPD